MNAWNAMKADTYRQYGRFSWGCLIKAIVTQRTFRVIVTLRLCQGVNNSSGVIRLTLPFFMILHRLTTAIAAMDMSWRTQIGGGFALTHGWAAVIGAPTKIGRNVTIFHGVTLGGSNRISRDGVYTYRGHPTLEDDVWVGPNAVITGKVTIGRGSRIAAGAFVTNSVPPYSLVVGNPAKIVVKNCVPDVMNPAPIETINQQDL